MCKICFIIIAMWLRVWKSSGINLFVYICIRRHGAMTKFTKMFTVDITGIFCNSYPAEITIHSARYSSAVRFYKNALHAHQLPTGVFQSRHGFTFRVRPHRYNSAANNSSVRLALPPKVSRAMVAHSLASGSRVTHHASGMRFRDPYGINWTLAWPHEI